MSARAYPNPLLTFPGWDAAVLRAEEARARIIFQTEGSWRRSENLRAELFRIGRMEANLERNPL